jgi:signal transduction histidine kinase
MTAPRELADEMSIFNKTAADKRIELVSEVPADLSVFADANALRTIIRNLLDNAIKYTPKGSVEMELTGDKNNVTLRVRDTGMGIAPDDLRHMFEKFYRVNNSLTRDIGGTGLGLYIARSLVEMYGGKMFVESKLGEGSTFGFSLPLAKK